MKKSFLFVFAFLYFCARVNAQPKVGSCGIFPANNPWNIDVSDTVKYPTNKLSATYIQHLNAKRQFLHPDFGNLGDPLQYGIPFEIVGSSQPLVQMTYNLYGDQSDPGPFPIPPDALVEASGDPNGDHHVLIVDTGRCMLYEFWRAQKDSTDDNWSSANGATFALSSNHYRPDTWTSGDAAGLPIFPGLVRYDEVRSGEITHAVRFTTDTSSKAWIFPARHHAGKYFDTTYPPMGLRLRLKAGYDISGFTGESLIILKALKKYGMILADNGGSWFISGATDNRWTVNDDNDLNHLKSVPGSAFEVVDMGYRIETDGDTITLPGDSLPVTQTPVRETVPPLNFSLDQNAPNPFSNNTVLHFITPANTRVMLNVYDALGRQVTTLVNGLVTAGEHTAAFSATGLPAGVYFARLQTGGTVIQRMMQVLR